MKLSKWLVVVAVLGAVIAPAQPASAATAVLQRVAPGAAAYAANAATFSGAGDVTAPASVIDVQIPPGPTENSSTSGCESADFAGFSPGSIAVLQRGFCTFAVKAANAQAAGASAVVIFNEGQPGRTAVFSGTLGAAVVTIPVVFTSFATGEELYLLRNSGLQLRVQVVTAFTASRPAVVRNSVNWLLRNTLTTGVADTGPFVYGTRPNVPFFGDWDGDDSKTAGSFENGVFKLNFANDNSAPELTFTFGDPRGFPVAGDFDGNGTDDVAVFRNGLWQVHYLGAESPADTSFSFGPAQSWPTVVPVAGDWNGDTIDGIGFYKLLAPATPLGQWTLRQTASNVASDSTVSYGGSGLYPVVGDWNADGFDTVGTKVMAGTTWQISNSNANPLTASSFDFGQANTDIPYAWR